MWQVTVLPIIAVIAFASIATRPKEVGADVTPALRGLIGVTAGLALLLCIPPTVSSSEIESSRASVNAGNLGKALEAANSAVEWQSYSALPWRQRALVYEQMGLLRPARKSAMGAIDREPQAWQNWFVLASVDAARGDVKGALRAYRRARDLNPESQLFKVSN
jgi:tetratricopeptide (TPR) repeat protein